MFKLFKKKENFPSALFVSSSLSALALLIGILFLIQLDANLRSFIGKSQTNKIYLKETKPSDDMLITKVPNLKDILAGPIITDADPNIGNPSSKVQIVEFSDFTCQYCQEQEKLLNNAVNKYKINLIWKDYPETSADTVSYKAAVAARCAQEQGKFWEYHDELFSLKKSAYNNDTFTQIAKELKMDAKKYNTCLNGSTAKKLINNNIEEANMLDIKGVPFIYVNNQEIMGETTWEELSRIIETELSK